MNRSHTMLPLIGLPTEASPAERTAATARVLLTAGVCAGLEAMWHGSVARIVISSVVLALSGGLLAYAKRSRA